MSFLCYSEGEKVTSNASCVQFNSVVGKDGTFLPTFTALIHFNNKSKEHRVLFDTGSQCNFITESVVKEFKLKSLETNVNLQIVGFNSVKNVITKIVEVPITVNKSNVRITAVVVPDITIKFKCKRFRLYCLRIHKEGLFTSRS